MKIIVDTNLLLRIAVGDNPQQEEIARNAINLSEEVIISCHTLCELIWVLRSRYGLSKPRILDVLVKLLSIDKVIYNVQAVESGLSMMEAGGDFADGVIAHEGRMLGGEVFVSFDQKATALLEKQGRKVQLLTSQ